MSRPRIRSPGRKVARQHVVTEDHGFGIAAQIQDHVVAVCFLLDHAADDGAFLVLELVDDLGTLSPRTFCTMTYGLGGDAWSKVTSQSSVFNIVADLDIRAARFEGLPVISAYGFPWKPSIGHHDPTAIGVVVAGLDRLDTHFNSPSYFFLVTVASAVSRAWKNLLAGTAFSLNTASTTSKISLFISDSLVNQSSALCSLFGYLKANNTSFLTIYRQSAIMSPPHGFDYAFELAAVVCCHPEALPLPLANVFFELGDLEQWTIQTRGGDLKVVLLGDGIFDIHDVTTLAAHPGNSLPPSHLARVDENAQGRVFCRTDKFRYPTVQNPRQRPEPRADPVKRCSNVAKVTLRKQKGHIAQINKDPGIN